jgi:hypothetical protein
MTMPLEERFAALEASNTNLSGDVQALTQAISVVNALQTEQREQARRSDEQARKLREVEIDARVRSERAQTVARRITLGFAILLPIASLLVYWILFDQVTRLLNENYNDRLRSCETRNAATESNMRRSLRLAAVEDNPEVAQIHRESAAELQAGIVDCSATIRLVSG